MSERRKYLAEARNEAQRRSMSPDQVAFHSVLMALEAVQNGAIPSRYDVVRITLTFGEEVAMKVLLGTDPFVEG